MSQQEEVQLPRQKLSPQPVAIETELSIEGTHK